MGNVDKATDGRECENVSADFAARYAFLKVVSDLPHTGVPLTSNFDLTHTIESEIIPRLILAHRSDQGRREAETRATVKIISAADFSSFFDAIHGNRFDDALALVVASSARGVPLESIMLDLLAPTAAKLGAMWEEDNVDFLSVTVSLGRLQQLLRHISGSAGNAVSAAPPGHKVLLCTVPGETHIFSLLLVDQFFRGGGWDVWTLPGASRDEVIDLVSREDFSLVGLSVSCNGCLAELQTLIPAIRRATKTDALRIMVGGPIFNGRPELAIDLGADGTASDGPSALIEARRMVESQAGR